MEPEAALYALTNCAVYTAERFVTGHALLIEGAAIRALLPARDLPRGTRLVDLGGRSVAPGFVDLQVNGGGDVLFNDDPTPATIARLLESHRRFGTVAMLPTLVTCEPSRLVAAVAAVEQSIAEGLPGVLGIHLEGPFISSAKAGAHDRRFIRALTSGDVELLSSPRRGKMLLTLAPEEVAAEHVAELVRHGVLVSAGHSAATHGETRRAISAGLSGATHLFNAMSGLESREPGVVGAALQSDEVWCGIIADGHHVHDATLELAWRAKKRGRLLLVTDAMPPVGGSLTEFRLGEHEVRLAEGRCTTADGRLAGSALDAASAVRNCVRRVGIPLDEALRMAATYPAEFLGLGDRLGYVRPGYEASLAIFDDEVRVSGVIVRGQLERWA